LSLVEKRRNSYIMKSVIGGVKIENLIVARPVAARRVKNGRIYHYSRLDVMVDDPVGPYYIMPPHVFEKVLGLYDRYEALRSVAQQLCSRFEAELEMKVQALKDELGNRIQQRRWLEENREKISNYEREVDVLEFTIKVIGNDLEHYTRQLEAVKKLCSEYVFNTGNPLG